MKTKEAIWEARDMFHGLREWLDGGYNTAKKEVHPIDQLDPYAEEKGAARKLADALDSYNKWLDDLQEKLDEEEADVIDDNLEPHGARN